MIVRNEMDNKLTGNPEIFPFLKTYKKYTNFSLDDDIKYIGNLKIDNSFSVNLSNQGDLLGDMNFILKIPKKFSSVSEENIINQKKMNDFIFILLYNTKYYFRFNQVTKEIILEPTNYIENNSYKMKDFYLSSSDNSVILNILKSFDIKILYHEDNLKNELNKFNNLHEKYLIEKGDKNIISNEHYIMKNYNDTVKRYFTDEYNFLNNTNFPNEIFEINKEITFKNTNLGELTTILVNLLNLVNNNNQRFIIDFSYFYNNNNNEHNYNPNKIISNIEINNNFEVNYRKIIGSNSQELTDMITEEYKNFYNNVFSKIIDKYNKDFGLEKLNLINQMMNYRLNMNDYILSLKNLTPNQILLDNSIKINFSNKLKDGTLLNKVNLAYKFLTNLDAALNNISKNMNTTNNVSLLLLKRIFYSYIYFRDLSIERKDFLISRQIRNYFKENLEFLAENIFSNSLINNNFYLSVDKQYPLNKKFILSEIKRTQTLQHFIILHDKINNTILEQEYLQNVQIYQSTFKNYKYYIDLFSVSLYQYIIFELYNFSIDNKPIIYTINNDKFYFNIVGNLDINKLYSFKIIGKTQCLDLTTYLSNNTNSLDLSGIRKITLKDDNTILFKTKNTFQLIKTDIIDKYDIFLNTKDINNNSNFTKNFVISNISNLYTINLNCENYQEINLILIPKKINIGKIVDKKILVNDLIIKIREYLLYYYTSSELELMMFNFYNKIENNSNNVSLSNSDLDTYIQIKYLEPIENKRILLSYQGIKLLANGNSSITDYIIENITEQGITPDDIYLDNPFIYHNLLELTSVGNTTNTIFSDFLIYHPIMVRISDNVSFLYNVHNFEIEGKYLFGGKNFITVKNINRNFINKAVQYKSTSILNTIFKVRNVNLEMNEIIDDILENIYEDPILKMLNDIEDTILQADKEFLSEVINNSFSTYSKDILNLVIKDNIKNNLLNQRTTIGNSSIFKPTVAEINYFVNLKPNNVLSALIKNNMTQDFFKISKLSNSSYESLKNLPTFIDQKKKFVDTNISNLQQINFNKIANKISSNFNFKDIIRKNISLSENNFNYIKKNFIKDNYLFKVDNKIVNEKNYDIELKNKFNTKVDYKIINILSGIIQNYNQSPTILTNQIIVNNNFEIKEGILLSPTIANITSSTPSSVSYKDGYHYKIKIFSSTNITDNIFKIFNGQSFYYLFLLGSDTTNSNFKIYDLVSENYIEFQQFINLETASSSSTINNYVTLLPSIFTNLGKVNLEVLELFNYNSYLISSGSEIYKNTKKIGNYYFNQKDKLENSDIYSWFKIESLTNINNPILIKTIDSITSYVNLSQKLDNDKIYIINLSGNKLITFDRIPLYISGEFIAKEIKYIPVYNLDLIATEANNPTSKYFYLNLVTGFYEFVDSSVLVSGLPKKDLNYFKIINVEKPYSIDSSSIIPSSSNITISNGNYFYNNYSLPSSDNSFIKLTKEVKFFNGNLSRVIQVKNSKKYQVEINGNITTQLNFLTQSSSFTMKIKHLEKLEYVSLQNINYNNRIIKINYTNTSSNTDFKEIIISLDTVIEQNKEYLVKLYLNNEIFYLNVYFNTSNLITLNDKNFTVSNSSTNENMKDSLSYGDIYSFSKNIFENSLNYSIFNFPKYEEINIYNEGNSTVNTIDIKRHDFVDGLVDRTSGYLNKIGDINYIYCSRVLNRGIKIKINETIIEILEVYGKVATFKFISNSNITFPLSFQYFIDLGTEQILNYDYDFDEFLSNNLLLSKTFGQDLILPIDSSIVDDIGSYIIPYSSGMNNNLNLVNYEEVLLLDENKKPYQLSRILYSSNYNLIDTSSTPNYIVTNGNNLKYSNLYINNMLYNLNDRCLNYNKVEAITWYQYDKNTKSFIVNQSNVEHINKTQFTSLDILKFLIKITNENNLPKTYFLLNNQVKIKLSINYESLKENLILYLNQKLSSNFKKDIDFVNKILTDLNISQVSDIHTIIDEPTGNTKETKLQLAIKNNFSFVDYIFISVCKIDLTIDNLTKNENDFILEFVENCVIIHFIKVINNSIVSNFILESTKSKLLYNGIFKIKLIGNKIKNLDNDYNLIRKINNNKNCSLIFEIPISLLNQSLMSTGDFKYNISISKDVLIDKNVTDVSKYPVYFDSNYKNPVNIVKNNETTNSTEYEIIVNKNKYFDKLYIVIPNQITFKKVKNTNKFIEDTFRLETYYTSTINNLTKSLITNETATINVDSTFDLPINYIEYFTTNLKQSIFRLKNLLKSYQVKPSYQTLVSDKIEILTSNNYLNIPGTNFNLYSKASINYNRSILSDNLIFDKVSSINLLEKVIDYDMFLKYCRDKESFYTVNNNFISKSGKIIFSNDSGILTELVTITNEQLILLNKFNLLNNDVLDAKYTDYKNGIVSIINNLRNNFRKIIIDNIDNFIQKNLPINFSYSNNRIFYLDNDYSDLILSLNVDSSNKITGHDYNLFFSFTNFIEKIKIYVNNINEITFQLKKQLSDERIFNFEYYNIVRYLQFLKYGNNYNQDYLENFSKDIYNFNLKKEGFMIGDEIYLNNSNKPIKYSTSDGKNLQFGYNIPDLVLTDLEIKRKANIKKVTNLGKIYKVTFSNGFILKDYMDVSYTDGSNFTYIDIYGSDLIYNINEQVLENMKFINLTDKIYIYKVEDLGLNKKYYFNINNYYLKGTNWKIVVGNTEYSISLEQSIENTKNSYFILNNTNPLNNLIKNHKIYHVFEIIEISSITYQNKYYVEIEIDKVYTNLRGVIKVNNEVINEIKAISDSKYRLELTSLDLGSNPQFIQDIHDDIVKKINVTNFQKTSDIYLFNYKDNVITPNTKISTNNQVPQLLINFNNNLYVKSSTTINEYYLENRYVLERIKKNVYRIPNNIDFIDGNNDYSIIYKVNSTTINLSDVNENNLAFTSNEETIELIQQIIFNKNLNPIIKNEYDIEYELTATDIGKENYQIGSNGEIIKSEDIINKFIIYNKTSDKLIVWLKHTIEETLSDIQFIYGHYQNITLSNITFGNNKLVYSNNSKAKTSSSKLVEIIPNVFDLFKKLNLYIDNELIDSIDINILKNIYNYHFNNDKKKQFNKITQLLDKGNHYQIYFPVLFYFYDKPHMFLPLVALTNNQVRIEGIVNYDCNLSLDCQTILLDKDERYIFGSYGHEYLIEKYHDYGNFIINGSETVNKIYFDGIIKNIYVKTIDDLGNNVETITNEDYGIIYQQFLTEKNNNSTFYIRIKDEVEINITAVTEIYQQPWKTVNQIKKLFENKKHISKIINNEFVLYLLYKFTDYLNNPSNLETYGLFLIKIINSFKLIKRTTTKPYLKTLNLKAGGESIFNKQDELYQRCVSTYKKIDSSLPPGHYFYTFSLQPEESNPTGHLNFNLFEESVLITTHQDNLSSRVVELNVITKEYNILKIISGMGSLMWKE